MRWQRCSYSQLWLVIVVLAIAGCHRTGQIVSSRAKVVLQERSLQPEVINPLPELWTLSYDYSFEAPTSPEASGTLLVDSELTVVNPGLKSVRITMYFLDSDSRVLDTTTFLRMNEFPTNPVLTHHEITTPPGTV